MLLFVLNNAIKLATNLISLVAELVPWLYSLFQAAE